MKTNYLSIKNGKLLVFTFLTSFSFSFYAQNTFPDLSGNTTFKVGVGTLSPANIFHVHDNFKDKLEFKEKNGLVGDAVKAQILITNDVTGQLSTDGVVLGTKNTSAYLTNQENGAFSIKSGQAALMLNGQNSRASVGLFVNNTNNKWAAFNVKTAKDNGLAIRVIKKDKFGLSVRVREGDDQAIKVVNDQGDSEFSVLGNGHVFARRYVTTLNNIPDYVFDENYKLIDLNLLDQYIKENGHLPNIPSAEEYQETGVDIGELNRLLLEKVEELTLYVIKLNNEIEKIKND